MRLIGNAADDESEEEGHTAVRRSSSGACLPLHVTEDLGNARVTTETLDVLKRSPAIRRMSAGSITMGSTDMPKRIRMEKLSKSVMSVKTAFDVLPYGLGLSASERALGGVAQLFEFYCVLFSAAKQLSTNAKSITAAAAERADATMSVGEMGFMLRGKQERHASPLLSCSLLAVVVVG